jgi:hypothetical protein
MSAQPTADATPLTILAARCDFWLVGSCVLAIVYFSATHARSSSLL